MKSIRLNLILLLTLLFIGGGSQLAVAEVVTGNCGATSNDEVTWSFDDQTCVLTISGTGATADYVNAGNYTSAPWGKYRIQMKQISITEGVTHIGNLAFFGCINLTSVTLPSSITSFGDGVFRNCKNLTSITLPSSIESLGDGVFYSCTNLKTLIMESNDPPTFPANDNTSKLFQDPTGVGSAPEGFKVGVPINVLPYYQGKIGTATDWSNYEINPYYEINGKKVVTNPILTSTNNNTYWALDNGTLVILGLNANIPTSAVGENAPWNGEKENITKIIIEKGITGVPASMFSGYTNLTEVTLNNSGTIGGKAFDGCTNLATVNIGKDVTEFGWTVSGGLSAIIYNYPFTGCSKLQTINVSDLGKFMDITNLVPTTVNNLGTLLGAGGKILKIDGAEPTEGKVALPADATTYNGTLKYFSNVTEIGIPASMTRVDGFSGHTNLKKMTIPSTVSIVAEYAFEKCTDLEEVTLDGGGTICSCAFMGCTNLKQVNLGDSKKIFSYVIIGNTKLYPFVNCKSLQTVSVSSLGQLKLEGVRHSDASQGTLYDEGNKVKTLLINKEEQDVVTLPVDASIGNSELGIFSNVKKIEFPEGYQSTTAGGFRDNKYLTEVIINPSSGITAIGNNAFLGCTALETITIPNGVTSIGSSAFSGCTTLSNISIPSTVNNIGTYAFNGCSGLTEIQIPDALTTLNAGVFSDCAGLTEITIPSAVTSIESYAFSDCSDLIEVTLNGGGTINGWAFSGCSNIAKLTIGSGVKEISGSPFYDCSKLAIINVTDLAAFMNIKNLNLGSKDKTLHVNGEAPTDGLLVIPEGVTTVADRMFEDFIGFSKVVLPASLTSIGWYVFGKNVTTVYCHAATPPTPISFTVNDYRLQSTLIVPNGSVDAYKEASYWKDFKSIEGSEIAVLSQSILAGTYESDFDAPSVTYPEGVTVSNWETSNPDVAKVENGKVIIIAKPYNGQTPYTAPTAIITATLSDGKQASCTVVVTPEAALVDGNAYTNAENLEFSKITYTRDNMPAGVWQALYVPFDMSYADWSAAGLDVAELYNIHQYDNDEDGTFEETRLEFLKLTENSTIKANTPYMVRSAKGGDVSIVVENAILYAAASNSIDCSSTKRLYTFTGIYEQTPITAYKEFVVRQSGALASTDVDARLNPYRWYMTITERNGETISEEETANTKIRIHIIGEDDEEDDSELTGIEEVISVNEGELNVYSLDGRNVKTVRSMNELQTAGLPSGIYIVNGKKYVVK